MFHIYIWGAGFYVRQVLEEIDSSKVKILGIIDSDRGKQGTGLFQPIPVIDPSDISGKEFDYLIISVKNFEIVEKACNELRIPSEKVIAYWKEESTDHVFINRALRVDRLVREKLIYQYRLDSAPYEWKLKPSPIIRAGADVLRKMLQDHSSLCRFGDGEFEMIRRKER